jgi:hypothetical protein
MKIQKMISWTLCLACLFCGSELFAQQEAATLASHPATVLNKRMTIAALSFNYFQGTAQWLDTQGLIEGAGTNPSLTGIANVSLQGGTVVTDFTMCGRDFAGDQEFVGDLYRKSINPADSAFLPPELMAHVNSGITFFSDNMQCLKTPVNASLAKIDNGKWTYFTELTIGDTTEAISVTLGYNCTPGKNC